MHIGTTPSDDGASGGLLESLKTLGRLAVDMLHTRLDLLATDLAEEQGRITELLLMGAVALLCIFLATVFAAFFIVVMFWDTPYRLAVPGVIAAALAIAAAAFWTAFRRRVRTKSKLFSATLEELGADIKRLG
jgi:uncharacterized membrane protein YqjE